MDHRERAIGPNFDLVVLNGGKIVTRTVRLRLPVGTGLDLSIGGETVRLTAAAEARVLCRALTEWAEAREREERDEYGAVVVTR